MERIRGEIISNVEKLQLEVHEITLRLNGIIHQNLKLAKHLRELSYKELLANKEYYLDVTHQQHTTIQILLSVNLQLEELQNNNKLTLKNALPKQEDTKEKSVTKKNVSSKVTCHVSGPNHTISENHTSNNHIMSSTSDSSTFSTADDANSADTLDDITETTKTNTPNKTERNKNPKQFADTVDCTVLSKLKQYGILSREKRYINHLQKPALPDLSFKKAVENVVTEAVNYNNLNEKRNAANRKPARDNNKPNKSKISLTEISEDTSQENKATSSERELDVIECPKVRSTSEVAKKMLFDATGTKQNLENEIFTGDIPQALDPYVKLNVLISHVKTPSEFYINFLDENIEAIERISVDYGQHHDSPDAVFLSKEIAKQKLQNYCLCYVDAWEFWYRAKVTDWQDKQETTDNVMVYLVDYGYSLDLAYKNLRPLLAKYADIPQCAIRCHLAYLFPPAYSEENPTAVWSQESILAFKNIIGLENHVVYEVAYVQCIDNSWAIDLVKPTDTEDDPSVGQLLIDANACIEILQPFAISERQANFIKAQLETAQGMHGITPEMNDNEKLEVFYKNTSAKEASSLEEALTCYKANDEGRTCQLYRRYGRCYKLPNCKFDHAPLRSDGYTTDKVEAHVETTLPLNLPSVGQTIDVRITSISSLTFWYAHITSNITAYSQLVKSLNDSKNVRNYKKFGILPSVGELLIVNCQTDTETSQWCRGQVREVYQSQLSPEETVQIFLVDTGEVIESKLSDLRIITKDLLFIPFQAVLLKLHGIKQNNANELDGTVYCETNFISQIFRAKVLHTSASTLVVSLTKHDVDIRKRIIEKGYGEIVEDDIYPDAYPLAFD